MKYYTIIVLFILLFTQATFLSCKEDYTPKPRAFVKIEFPSHSYKQFSDKAPFQFEYPAYGEIVRDSSVNAEAFWYNILLPAFNGTIYLSYKKINRNLPDLVEDSRKLAYKHSIKADAIDESLIRDTERKVYGIIYDLKGNTASSLQFFVSDSLNHFLRGSLYFNTQPDKDSLAPVIRFVREDVIHLINTIKWE